MHTHIAFLGLQSTYMLTHHPNSMLPKCHTHVAQPSVTQMVCRPNIQMSGNLLDYGIDSHVIQNGHECTRKVPIIHYPQHLPKHLTRTEAELHTYFLLLSG